MPKRTTDSQTSNVNRVNPDNPNSQDSSSELENAITESSISIESQSPTSLPTQSILEEIGIVGCNEIEPLIVASLVTEEPLLLIGPHGTGKSLLINRISEALGLKSRHYNASILNFDDLIGYPVPNEDDSLSYIRTENSIWEANLVFFDEISRCRLDIQNKMFPIVHEQRVQGIELEELRYRWAAMIPTVRPDDDEEYLGSEPLDVAFADRFSLLIEMPAWSTFSETEQKAVIQMPATLDSKTSSRLLNTIKLTKDLLPHCHDTYGDELCEYVYLVSKLLAEVQTYLSPRRMNMLLRSLLAVYSARLSLDLQTSWSDLCFLVLKHSLPMRCTGVEIKPHLLLSAHRRAWDMVKISDNESLKLILHTDDLLSRLKLLVTAEDINKNDRSTLVSDVFSRASRGRRAAIAKVLCESGYIGSLNAASADEIGSLYQLLVQPFERMEYVNPESRRYIFWREVEGFISKLNSKKDPQNQYIVNYITRLFTSNELSDIGDVQDLYHSWEETIETLQGIST